MSGNATQQPTMNGPPVGLNINPTLINIGGSLQPNIVVGYSVAPALISVQPSVDLRIKVKKSVGSPMVTANIIPRPPQPPVTPKPPKELPNDPKIGKLDVNITTLPADDDSHKHP